MASVRVCLVILFLFVKGVLAAPGNEFVSANGRFSVDLSRTPENELLIAVREKVGEEHKLRWNRAIEWQDPDPVFGQTSVTDIKALISDNGATVILRDYATSREVNGLRFVGPAKEDERTFRPFNRHELTGMPKREPFATHGYPQLREGTAYMHCTAILDFIFEEENAYALWFGQTDHWLLISLSTYKETVAHDSATIERLNTIARHMALEIVGEHQPAPIRKAVEAVKEQVARFVPSFRSPPTRRWLTAKTSAAYLFLSSRRVPADKPYIEHLVHYPIEGIQGGQVMNGDPLKVTFTINGGERLIGDFLLRHWNRQTNKEYLPAEQQFMVAHDSLHYLGSARVRFDLPFASPDNPGVLWLYLIPSEIPISEWKGAEDVVPFTANLSQAIQQFEGKVGSNGEATVHGITPGEYRVKLVWERHRPAGVWRTNIYAPVPGDYESAESKSVLIKPGETNREIILPCTNRVGAAAAYELDDRRKSPRP